MLKKRYFAMLLMSLVFVIAACNGDDDNGLEETAAPTAEIGAIVAPTQDEGAIIEDEDAVIDVSGEIELHIPQEQITTSATRAEGEPDYYVLSIGATDEQDVPIFSITLTLQTTLEPGDYRVIYCEEEQAPPPDAVCATTIGTEGSIYRDITSGTLTLESLEPLSGNLALVSNKVPAPTEGAGLATAEVTEPLPLGTVAVDLAFVDVPITEQ